MRQPPPPDVAFVVDTSGSVSDAMISDLKGEIKGVLKAVGIGGKRLHVLSVDAKVHTKQSVGNVGQIRLGGGGGTDMRVGIEAATQMKPRPAIVIVGTDGYTPWPDTQPPGITLIALLVGDDPPETPGWIRRVVVTD